MGPVKDVTLFDVQLNTPLALSVKEFNGGRSFQAVVKDAGKVKLLSVVFGKGEDTGEILKAMVKAVNEHVPAVKPEPVMVGG